MIFNLVKTLLIVICVLIIFSLLMLSIDSKAFETAVIQTLGLQKSGVVALVVFQSFSYVIPAVSLAILISAIVLHYAADYFMAQYSIQIDRFPSLESSLQALSIGVIIPLISSILPV